MFVFDPDFTFEWPVKVQLPGGEVKEFTGRFRMPEDEKDIFERVTGEDTPSLIEAARVRLCKYWIGWSGIQVKDGGELPFSDANRQNLLKQRPIRMAVDHALFEALIGMREKN